MSEDSEQESFRDQFLIALPVLKEDYFGETVCLLADHNGKGAFGLVINKPLDMELEDPFPEHEFRLRCPIMEGGPVDNDRLFFLHDSGHEFESTYQVSEDLALTTSTDLVDTLVDGTGPQPLLAVLGYAGWDAGQLEKEIAEDVWLLSPASKEVIFETPYPQRSMVAASTMGVDLNLLATAGHG